MLFVTAIEPIENYKKRVIIADTETPHVGSIVYGDSVTDEVIRQRAVEAYETTDAYKKYKRKRGKTNA